MALAVGRRKRLASAALGTVNGTIYTAPAAPGDGSAAASFTMTICNTNATSVTVTISVPGTSAYLYSGYTIPANDTLVHNMTIDLMGAETLQGFASSSGVYINLTGIEISAN